MSNHTTTEPSDQIPSYERSQLAAFYRDTLRRDSAVQVQFSSVADETQWLDISLDTYRTVMQAIVKAAEGKPAAKSVAKRETKPAKKVATKPARKISRKTS